MVPRLSYVERNGNFFVLYVPVPSFPLTLSLPLCGNLLFQKKNLWENAVLASLSPFLPPTSFSNEAETRKKTAEEDLSRPPTPKNPFFDPPNYLFMVFHRTRNSQFAGKERCGGEKQYAESKTFFCGENPNPSFPPSWIEKLPYTMLFLSN